jgi:exo-beta-1,3-glucanase (GH17 family)
MAVRPARGSVAQSSGQGRPVTHVSRSAVIALLLLTLAHVTAVHAGVGCPAAAPAASSLARLGAVMAHGRFVTYQPTSLKVVNGQISPARPEAIRADLALLRKHFDALITYNALHGDEAIPAIAQELGYRALIVGVWDPGDATEVDAAAAAALRFPRLVLGIALGNETLFAHRSDPRQLMSALTRLRAHVPGVALTTSEPFHVYGEPENAALLAALDFLLPNVHPVFQPWFRDAPEKNDAQFVVNVLAELAALSCGPVLVKETGEPSAPAQSGYSEARQAAFYRELRAQLKPSATRAVAYFAAFDAPWREYDATPTPGAHAEEAHWGLYDAERRPKLAARELPALRP